MRQEDHEEVQLFRERIVSVGHRDECIWRPARDKYYEDDEERTRQFRALFLRLGTHAAVLVHALRCDLL